MNPLRQLASQTAIYGLSSIVGRLLNYLLVPLHTRVFAPEAFGVVTEMYSYVAFLLVVLTYGFETAFFRYAREAGQKDKVYSTALASLAISSVLFFLGIMAFSEPLANWIRYPEHPEYITWFAFILAADALTAIPFAQLRLENRPMRFALVRLSNIALNIALNLFWLWLCPNYWPEGISGIYDPSIGVGYVFLANLAASVLTLLMLLPEMLRHRAKPDWTLWRTMIIYGLPLLVGGLAGITNEMFSRISMKYQLPEAVAMHELGVFGACYKVSILMTIFIQTFRFAAEPFFFSRAKDKNAPALYATVMHWFIIACSFIYLGVMVFMNMVSHFVGEEYREGLGVVPVLLMANLFLGVYYNLSIWYKLNDRTALGAWMAIGGALLTILLNYWWIPYSGYIGASWATFTVYGLMVVVSYGLGMKFYPIPYDLKRCVGYPLLAVAMVSTFVQLNLPEGLGAWLFRLLMMLLFAALVWRFENLKKNLPSPKHQG
jgi:O-antigen/teichoic acid export membrane protein